MKRIMFYKNRSHLRTKSIMPWAYLTAELLIVYTCYLCGSILGCACYHSVEFIRAVSTDTVQAMGSVSALNKFLCACFGCILIVICFVFSSFSCFGAVPMCMLAAFSGFRFAVLASALFAEYAWRGFLIFVVLLLPGGVLLSIAELILFSYGITVSKRTAACMFNANDVQISIKEYITYMAVPILLMLAANVTDFIMRILFSGMVYSGI